MKIASVAEVKARLSSYLKASAAGPIVVTRNGHAVAVLLGVRDDEEVERIILAHSRKLRAILDAADRRIDQGAGIGHDQFWTQVESSARARESNGSQKRRRIGSNVLKGRRFNKHGNST
jgi:prevent-host-death family protein